MFPMHVVLDFSFSGGCLFVYDNLRIHFKAHRWLSSKESACQYRSFRRPEFNPGVGKIPWKRKWQPIPVFLLGKFLKHGCRVNVLTKKGGGG